MIGPLAVGFAAVIGAWLHELTHAVAAVLLGGRYESIDLLGLHVDFTVPSDRREQAVRWAPFVVGQLALTPLLGLEGWALLTALMGWTVYTWLGGPREPGLAMVGQKILTIGQRIQRQPESQPDERQDVR